MLRQGVLLLSQPVSLEIISLQLRELARHGLEEILLCTPTPESLAGLPPLPRMGADARCSLRPCLVPSGVGSAGGLVRFKDALAERFLVRDAACFLDINCLELAVRQLRNSARACAALSENGENSGTVVLDKECLDWVRSPREDLASDLLPRLHTAGMLDEALFARPCRSAGEFLSWPQSRPAVFFDRDGVLNKDNGFVYQPEAFEWNQGAVEAVKLLNDAGWFVFVVTNQSGVARGYYPESAVNALHAWMQGELGKCGAHVDAFYYCPYYAKGSVPAYTREHPDRKPAPGMLLRAMEQWPVRVAESFLIGDKESDLETARRAGIPGYRFAGGDLAALVRGVLDAGRKSAPRP